MINYEKFLEISDYAPEESDLRKIYNAAIEKVKALEKENGELKEQFAKLKEEKKLEVKK